MKAATKPKRKPVSGLKVVSGNGYLELSVNGKPFIVTYCGAYLPSKNCWEWSIHGEGDGKTPSKGTHATWAGAQRAAFRAAEKRALLLSERARAKKSERTR